MLRQMLRALVSQSGYQVTVITGNADTSAGIEDLVTEHENLTEQRFLMDYPSAIRYLISKVYFRFYPRMDQCDWFISFNYLVPVRCKLFVYHINLLTFVPPEKRSFLDWVKGFDARLACRKADANIFESEYLKKSAQKATGTAIRNPGILYVGVNQEFFLPPVDRQQKDLENGIVSLLLVSSPQPHKKNEICIQALARLCSIRPDVNWQLEICGGQNVTQWSKVLDFARTEGVYEQVRVLGPQSLSVLGDKMANSFCLINPSVTESFCMVAVEAMAAGCPVIVTDQTSMPESVGDAGLVVEADSPDQFADAVLTLVDDPALRDSLVIQGRERAAGFSAETFASGLVDLLS